MNISVDKVVIRLPTIGEPGADTEIPYSSIRIPARTANPKLASDVAASRALSIGNVFVLSPFSESNLVL
jgi:hypothetical protein